MGCIACTAAGVCPDWFLWHYPAINKGRQTNPWTEVEVDYCLVSTLDSRNSFLEQIS